MAVDLKCDRRAAIFPIDRDTSVLLSQLLHSESTGGHLLVRLTPSIKLGHCG